MAGQWIIAAGIHHEHGVVTDGRNDRQPMAAWGSTLHA